MRNFEKDVVYYNYRNGLFYQYRGNGNWGHGCRFWNDARTVTYNEKTSPPWYMHRDLVAVPHPIECNFMTESKFGWISRMHEDHFVDPKDWSSFDRYYWIKT